MAKKKPSKRIGAIVRAAEDDVKQIASKAQAMEDSIMDLSPVQVKEMSNWLRFRIDDAAKSKMWTETKDRILKMRRAYEEGVARTSIDMDGAHDYRTSLSASQTDAMVARLLNIYAVDPLIKIEGRDDKGRLNAPNAEQWLDYHHDVNVRLAARGDSHCTTASVEGHVVLYCPWSLKINKEKVVPVERQVYIKGTETRMVDFTSQLEISQAEAEDFVPKDPPEYDVIDITMPVVEENFPKPQEFSLLDYLCPSNAKPGVQPAWESVLIYFTMDELEIMRAEGKIYPGVMKELKSWVKKQQPAESEKEINAAAGADQEIDTSDGEPNEKDASDAVVGCRVIWGLQKVPGKKRLQRMATIYHRESNNVIQTRIVPPYADKDNPFFHLRLITVPWRFAGIGVMELSMPGERAINDMANFVLDEGRIFSCLPYKYNKKRFPGGLPPFEFWKGLGVTNMKDVEPLDFGDRRAMDINVAGFLRGHMERRTGQGDLQLGRESDLTGKQPPTARGTISIIREGMVRFTKLNFGIVNELVRMGQYEITMFQYLLGKETPVDILGPDGKDVFPDGISRNQLIGAFRYTANAAAQNMARELDAELNMMLYDRFKDNPFISTSMSSFYEMTRDVLLSMGKKKLWIKPLNFYRRASGRIEENGASLTPDEQKFVQGLLAAGVPPEEAKAELEKMRAGGSKETHAQEPVSPEQEKQLLLGGEGK